MIRSWPKLTWNGSAAPGRGSRGEELPRTPFPANARGCKPRADRGHGREPGDVDMGLILSVGFPAFVAGCCAWADSLGLPAVLERLHVRRWDGIANSRPTEQMKKLAAEGKGFYPG